VDFDDLETLEIPAGTYAVFVTGCGGFAGDELPRLREAIFGAWLADSGFEQARDYEVEVYHLFPKGEKHKRKYELWIPVRRKHL
jgi:AraC family transcriptional regulator